MTEPATTKAALEKAYFEQASGWDQDINQHQQRSEKRAWLVAMAAIALAVLEAVGIATLAPLKSVEPFVIRVDNNTGVVDVVSVLAETNGEVKQAAQEALDKYWLSQYIRHREGYCWDTRDHDRRLVGLLSASTVQQNYAAYTDPKRNPQAPVLRYGQNARVTIYVTAISFINTGETVDGEHRVTALVRYTKQVKRAGETAPLTHWAATVTFVYRAAPMKIEDRLVNPLGFQIIGYRNDPESVGG